ncbi:hypothetical protein FRC17_011134 [Serendipita sp. 399]|nr:hypothetical protein FRC17_011134 [Serendipita sp. 399]
MLILFQWLLLWCISAIGSLGDDANSRLRTHYYTSTPVTISHLFDNVATEDFDGTGCHYPVDKLPTGTFTSENVVFSLPDWGEGQPDNVVASGQTLHVDLGRIREFHILYAGDWIDGETGNRFKFGFKDWSSQSVEVSVKNWWNLHWLNSGPIQLPHHHVREKVDFNITQIHHWSTQVDSRSPLRTIHFPPTSRFNWLHVFAISLVPAVDSSDVLSLEKDDAEDIVSKLDPAIALKDLRPTLRWVEKADDGPKEPIVEVTIANMLAVPRHHSIGVLDGDYAVNVVGMGIHTSVPGRIKRLIPGDDARVDVGLVVSRLETTVHVELYDVKKDRLVWRSEAWELQLEELHYEATRASLMRHETPRWWRNAKFGIFIHWGVYSVPGWVPTGYYEEWYHWWIHNPAQPSNILWNYHRNKYGEDVVYDDFIPGFNGAKFNASQWINLFHDAGAKYFVIVTKHHDGFALFDTEDSTHRSSVHLGPKRDVLGELMSAAKEEHPDMKRGTYYSMPEWFNPAFKKYGFGNWPGGLARNAYNASKWEPYTGHIEGKDYLRDIQEAHMKILAEKYETDIMWCDIGGPNRTIEFASKWYNDGIQQNRQVTMNNRCGVAPDFDTPEYARFSSIQTRAWETNEGIDPYGYNQQTRDEDYRSTEAIIHSLVDIVSKNGNYLLNLGPTGEGEIIPAMIERLEEVGRWLGHSGECIYDTIYSFPGAEEGRLRFTTTPDSFCIISLSRPDEAFREGGTIPVDDVPSDSRQGLHEQQVPWEVYRMEDDNPVSEGRDEDDEPETFKPRPGHSLLVVERPVPILPKDSIYLLGGSGKPLHWKFKRNRLGIFIPSEELDRVSHAWAFKIVYA